MLIGSLVLNRFEITDRLGSGGFGVVYRAWDSRLERDVAVKVIEVADGAGGRVLREAQAAARLNHRGIVTLYELGEQDGRAFLVSELVEGATLQELTGEGRLCDREVAEIGADLCEALDHAHSRGVIHRDIKPHNVLVPAGDAPAKLMDFGIARVLDTDGLTATGAVVGTLAYMAPEQAEGGLAGPAADVYGLALTLYECWSGENPHRRATPTATARSIGTPVASLGRARPDLPPERGRGDRRFPGARAGASTRHRGAGHGDRVLPGGARGGAGTAAAAPLPAAHRARRGDRGQRTSPTSPPLRPPPA